MGNDIGITIRRAHAGMGDLFAEFEIRTNAYGGFERYKWQVGSQPQLWRINGHGENELLAEGDRAVWGATKEALGRVHSVRNALTYSEFTFLVRGWIAGADAVRRDVGLALDKYR